MKRIFSRAILGAAVLSSVATSSSEPPPAPVGPRSSVATGGDVVLAPGQSATRVFRVGVRFDDMPEIVDSWVEADTVVQTGGGSGTIEVVLEGFNQSDSSELFADTSAYQDVITINGIETGCLSGGDGRCWSTWTARYTHVSGGSEVFVDWSVEAVVPEDGFDLAIEIL